MKTCISLNMLRELSTDSRTICLDENSVLSPSAKDYAREKGLVIYLDGRKEPIIGVSTGAEPLCHAGKPASSICENPKAMKVEGDKVVMEPFTEAPAGQKIGMTDVITEREGNLGAGFMTFENSELPWTLSYDEVDYVVEGEFTIKTGGELYHMKPGDVFHIPKGTSVVFGSPSFCKVFYVVYPANWLSQNK